MFHHNDEEFFFNIFVKTKILRSFNPPAAYLEQYLMRFIMLTMIQLSFDGLTKRI
jgi:hypothetical protein